MGKLLRKGIEFGGGSSSTGSDSSKWISQADYDALSDAEKDADITYYIYDAVSDLDIDAFSVPFTGELYEAGTVGDALNEVKGDVDAVSEGLNSVSNNVDAVNESLTNGLGQRQIRTYVTLAKLGITTATATLLEIITNLQDNSIFQSYINVITDYANVTGYNGGILEVKRYSAWFITINIYGFGSKHKSWSGSVSSATSNGINLDEMALNSDLDNKVSSVNGIPLFPRLTQQQIQFTDGVANVDLSAYREGKRISQIAFAVPYNTGAIAITGVRIENDTTLTIRARDTSANTAYAGTVMINLQFFLY